MIPDAAEIQLRLAAAFPTAAIELIPNASASGEHSLRIDAAHARAIALFLRDDETLHLDFASNVTGVDWPEKSVTEKVKVKRTVEGVEKELEESVTRVIPGCLEVVYHLFSMAKKHGPVILRIRTGDRASDVHLPSLTPVWRSCELQEREVFDLFGVIFDDHPDLRRILMWDGYEHHPMRRDFVEPDDYEWEPTPHGDVLAKAQRHRPPDGPMTTA